MLANVFLADLIITKYKVINSIETWIYSLRTSNVVNSNSKFPLADHPEHKRTMCKVFKCMKIYGGILACKLEKILVLLPFCSNECYIFPTSKYMAKCPYIVMYVSGLKFLSWRLHTEVLLGRPGE